MSEAPEPKLVYEMEINQPNLPQGELVQIPGLGTYENGGTYDINADEAESYRVYHTRLVPVRDETEAIVGMESQPGPTLLQASKTMYGVEVTTYAKQPSGGEN